ncbi:acetyl-coenzyme A carboxylase carboxyltransferase subunit alpha [Striga asiatica]|uniref:Acetyl-coenzyme A carboxylase carboxyltransferase subunit alpha n=1 Tax=Striga asiatica TaxID=4170 RepID=A0A5A7PN76_STRAF|nr:acetyl-coenzyme A carboxylase carboxyltransferase subunit alpha [Striga asiatica]
MDTQVYANVEEKTCDSKEEVKRSFGMGNQDGAKQDDKPPHVANHHRFRLVKPRSTEPRDCRSPARRNLESAPEHDVSVDLPSFVLDSYWKNNRPIHKSKVKLGIENGEWEMRIGN